MRQRLHIARGLLHRPDVLFLDEPSIGVDPVAARDLRRTVADLAAAGTTVLLTTHYMAEADEFCDRIAVIAGGRIRASAPPTSSSPSSGDGTCWRSRRTGWTTSAWTAAADAGGAGGVGRGAGRAAAVTCRPGGGAELHGPVLAELDGVRIGRVTSREPSLEDAYIAIVEGAADGASVAGAVAG